MQQDKAVGSVRLWEVLVALFFLVFGSIVSWDSHRLGSSWASDGPQAGYFPFYIGVIIIVSAIVNLYSALRLGEDARVVSPADLADEVRSTAAAALAQYE